jgi:hypothetical protein
MLGQRPSGRFENPPAKCRRKRKAYHRDTPPEDDHVAKAGLLARGSVPSPAFPRDSASPVALMDVGSPLTVAGAAPASPLCGSPASLLAPGKCPKNHGPVFMGGRPTRVKPYITTSLCLYPYVRRTGALDRVTAPAEAGLSNDKAAPVRIEHAGALRDWRRKHDGCFNALQRFGSH